MNSFMFQLDLIKALFHNNRQLINKRELNKDEKKTAVHPA